jgi:hypothetical protein
MFAVMKDHMMAGRFSTEPSRARNAQTRITLAGVLASSELRDGARQDLQIEGFLENCIKCGGSQARNIRPAQSGDSDHDNIGGARIVPNHLAERDAVKIRHADVRTDDVWMQPLCGRQGLYSVRRRENGMAQQAEVRCENVATG